MKNLILKSICIAAIALPLVAQQANAAAKPKGTSGGSTTSGSTTSGSTTSGSTTPATSGVASAGAIVKTGNTLTVGLSDVTNTDTENYPTVKITLSETTTAGTIAVKVEVVPGKTGGTGDLRGVYFNLPSGVTGASIAQIGGGPITALTTSGNFGSFNNSADLQGSGATFSAGVEIGRQGIPDGDDYQTTEFTISGTGLTLAKFASAEFGTRMMSVSDSLNGNRGLSSKTLGTAPSSVVASAPAPAPAPGSGPAPEPGPSPATEPEAVPVPEPITMVGMGLGLGALVARRRNQNKKN